MRSSFAGPQDALGGRSAVLPHLPTRSRGLSGAVASPLVGSPWASFQEGLVSLEILVVSKVERAAAVSSLRFGE